MTEVVLEQKPQTVAVSSFGKRNTNRDRIEREEEELKQMTQQREENAGDKPAAEENNDDDTNLSAEEKSFKKRYGDLRRHSQQQQHTLQKQIDELKGQLQQSTEKQIKLPKSEEELAEWARAYPDIAKIVETIAIKKAKEQTQEIDNRFKQLDEREQPSARDKAEADLMKVHPDFNDIRDSDEFHNWVDEQPKWVQDALYENDSDARAASRAIDLYKADKGIKTKQSSSYARDAASSINTRGARSAPVSEDRDGVFTESQVAKMSSRDYEKNEEAIQKAMRSGKFVYDLSAGAR